MLSTITPALRKKTELSYGYKIARTNLDFGIVHIGKILGIEFDKNGECIISDTDYDMTYEDCIQFGEFLQNNDRRLLAKNVFYLGLMSLKNNKTLNDEKDKIAVRKISHNYVNLLIKYYPMSFSAQYMESLTNNNNNNMMDKMILDAIKDINRNVNNNDISDIILEHLKIFEKDTNFYLGNIMRGKIKIIFESESDTKTDEQTQTQMINNNNNNNNNNNSNSTSQTQIIANNNNNNSLIHSTANTILFGCNNRIQGNNWNNNNNNNDMKFRYEFELDTYINNMSDGSLCTYHTPKSLTNQEIEENINEKPKIESCEKWEYANEQSLFEK